MVPAIGIQDNCATDQLISKFDGWEIKSKLSYLSRRDAPQLPMRCKRNDTLWVAPGSTVSHLWSEPATMGAPRRPPESIYSKVKIISSINAGGEVEVFCLACTHVHRGTISVTTHKNPIGLLGLCGVRQKVRPLIVFSEQAANFLVAVTPLIKIMIFILTYWMLFICFFFYCMFRWLKFVYSIYGNVWFLYRARSHFIVPKLYLNLILCITF